MGVIGFITGATLVESSLGYAFVSLKKLSQDSNPTLVLCNHAFTILFWTSYIKNYVSWIQSNHGFLCNKSN